MKIDPGFVGMVNALLAQVPLSCTRWGSTEQHNVRVGGAKSSAHLTWEAVDFVADSTEDLIRAAKAAQGCGFNGIELDLRNLHLHVDVKPRLWRVAISLEGKETPLNEYLQSLVV